MRLHSTRSKCAAVFSVLATSMTVVAMGGCRATPPPESKFNEGAPAMHKQSGDPFERSWFQAGLDGKKYDEILVRPVNMNYVMAQNWWEGASAENSERLKKDFKTIADYTRGQVIQAAQTDPAHRFKVVETAGPRTMVVELAITQLVPSKVGLQLAGIATPWAEVLMVGGGVLTSSQDTGKGVIAIEGRVRDGGTKKVIFMFADREAGVASAVDMTAYSWWGPEKYYIDTWANDLVQVLHNPATADVKAPPTFQLMVW